MAKICAVGVWVSFGTGINSIGQRGVRLIVSRFGFGANGESIAGRNGNNACTHGFASPVVRWGLRS